MADYVTIQTPNGPLEIPAFVLESTGQDIKKLLEALNSTMGSKIDTLINKSKEQLSNDKKSAEEADKDRNETAKLLGEIADNATTGGNIGAAVGEKFANGIVTATSGLIKFGAALTAIGTGVALAIGNTFLDVGKDLNELTRKGVGFDGAIDTLADFSSMGLDAVEVLKQYSNVVAVAGGETFKNMINDFRRITHAGADLGMTLEESTERFSNELVKRQLMGALDTANQARMNQQIQTTIKNQQKYAQALGTSVEELESFTDNLLMNTPALQASLNRLNSDLRSKVIAGITDFGTAMRGLGGSEGGKIAEAFTEAAAAGAMGFSDSMVGYVTALPSLAGPMSKYIQAVQSGTLTQDQATEMAENLAKNIGNVTESEKARIFALARTGDQYAQSLASAITQFEQSEKKMRDLGVDPNGVQRGTNIFNSIVKQLTGTFEALRYRFMAGVGSVEGLSDTFDEMFEIIDEAVSDTFPMFSKDAKNAGNALGEFVNTHVKRLAEGFANFVRLLPSLWDKLKNGVNVLIDGLFGKKNTDTGEREGGMFDKLKQSIDTFTGWWDGFNQKLPELKTSISESIETFKTLATVIGATVLALKAWQIAMGVKGMFSKGGAPTAKGGKAAVGLGGVPQMLAFGAAAAAVGFGINQIADGVKKLGEMKLTDLAQGIGAVTVVVGGFTAALVLAAPALSAAAPAVGAFGTALLPAAASAALFGAAIGGTTAGIGVMLEGVASLTTAIGGLFPSDGDKAAAEVARMKGAADVVEQLANTPNEQIDATSLSIKNLSESLVAMSSAVGSDGWFSDSGADIDKQEEQVEIFNMFASIDSEGIVSTSDALSAMFETYSKFLTLDASKLLSVSEAMAKLNESTEPGLLSNTRETITGAFSSIGSKLGFSTVASPNSPQQTQVATTLNENNTIENNTQTTNKIESYNNELIETLRMLVEAQNRTNTLLRNGNLTQREIADNI